MSDVLQDHLKVVRKRFMVLLEERLDELEDLREQIDSNIPPDEALKQIQFIAHKIAGTAGMLGFEKLGKLAAKAENTIIPHLARESVDPTITTTVAAIDAFIETAAEISSSMYWETA